MVLTTQQMPRSIEARKQVAFQVEFAQANLKKAHRLAMQQGAYPLNEAELGELERYIQQLGQLYDRLKR